MNRVGKLVTLQTPTHQRIHGAPEKALDQFRCLHDVRFVRQGTTNRRHRNDHRVQPVRRFVIIDRNTPQSVESRLASTVNRRHKPLLREELHYEPSGTRPESKRRRELYSLEGRCRRDREQVDGVGRLKTKCLHDAAMKFA